MTETDLGKLERIKKDLDILTFMGYKYLTEEDNPGNDSEEFANNILDITEKILENVRDYITNHKKGITV